MLKEWVPPILSDIKLMLNSKKHPFYEHSDAEFYVARDANGEMLGRIALLENKPSNKYHDKKVACFYLFESLDDQAIANKLFETGFDWAHKRAIESGDGAKRGYRRLTATASW